MNSVIAFIMFVVVESYELTGKHTYLPMSITIGSLLVILLVLAGLYKDLDHRSKRRKMKAATTTMFRLSTSQELSCGKVYFGLLTFGFRNSASH